MTRWLPDLLSLSRVPLAAALWLFRDRAELLLLLAALAALTDVADGFAARRLGVAGPRSTGAWLDPVCDKIFVASLLGVAYAVRRPPLYFLGLLLFRELCQVPLLLLYLRMRLHPYWRGARYDFRSGPFGKATTVTQFLAIGVLVLGLPGARALCCASFVLGALAIGTYVQRARRTARAFESANRRPGGGTG